MSRNTRQKQPSTPAKKVKVKVVRRRDSDSSTSSSSLNLSDEDGYSGVEDISDSDEEEDVMAAEEEHIVHNESHNSDRNPPRPTIEADDDADEEGGDEEAVEDEDEDEDEDDDDEENDDGDEEDDADEADATSSWEGFMSDGLDQNLAHDTDEQDLAIERKVRFDVPDSDGDSTETDEDVPDFFPDIFVDKRSLDASFRREIDLDELDQSSDSGGFWDFTANQELDHTHRESHQYTDDLLESEMDSAVFAAFEEDDSTPVATPMTTQDAFTAVSTPAHSPDMDDELSLDGYESDGDTTEEEDPPEQVIRRNNRRERTVESSTSEAASSKLVKYRRVRPRVGRFNLDSTGTKPVAVVHPRTGKLMIFTPQRLRHLDLSPEQFNSFPFMDQSIQSSPILSTSGNLMMGAMFASGTFGDYVNTQAVGPAEAFFPTPIEGAILEESSMEEEGEEDEGEHMLEIDDFITFEDNNESSDDDEQGKGPSDNDDILTSPTRPTTASSGIASLLDHFEGNSNVVGAFRRDQANHQLIRNGKASRESLAFSGPLFEGTLRGIKAGRIATTNVPITPLRRRKDMPDLASSPLSNITQKRKASSEQHMGHKRQRSIPDVNPLHI